jgi:hypothetical protein
MQVPPGHAILFCGYTMHTGVPITAGTRYVLTGFVGGRPLSFTPARGLARQVRPHGFRRLPRGCGSCPSILRPHSRRACKCSARRPHPSLHTAPSQARHPLRNGMQVLSTAPAPLSSHGPIPGAPPTPELHAECLPLFTGTLPTLRLERAACMQVLITAPAPHPSLHRHAAHSVWSGQQRLPLATPRHEPRAPLPRLWRRPR